MGQWVNMLGVIVGVLLIAAVGAAARRAGLLNRQADQSILRVMLNVLMPALVLSVIPGNPKLQSAGNVLVPPAVGFATVTGGFAIAWLAARLLKGSTGLTEPRARRTFAFCTGVYNYSFVPLPLAMTLFDSGTAGVLFVHNLGVEVAIWTLGIVLVSGSLGQRWYLRLLNVPILAIAGALLLHVTGAYVYIPQFLKRHTIEPLGQMFVPMALLMVGATVADEFEDASFIAGWRLIGLASVLRQILLPALFLLVALLPLTHELKAVIALQAAMPAAVLPVVLTRHYGGDVTTAVRVAVGTAVISLLATPLWLTLGFWLLGLR